VEVTRELLVTADTLVPVGLTRPAPQRTSQ
jgi:hypothetical protein